MQVEVDQDGQRLGPFPRDAALEMARLGSIPPDALVRPVGVDDWQTVQDFVATYDAVANSRSQAAASYGTELGSITKAVGAGFGVAIALALPVAFLIASLPANRGTSRIITPVLLVLGWLTGYVVSRVSHGISSWLLILGAAFAALIGGGLALVLGSVWSDGEQAIHTGRLLLLIGVVVAAGWTARD